MSLWTPYKEEPRVPEERSVTKSETKPQSLPDPGGAAVKFHEPPMPVTSPTVQQPSYHYIGYDPVPHYSQESSYTRASSTPDSGCSSGSISPQPRLKISRPFRQMTSRTGTTMNNIRDYYAQVLQQPTSNPRMRRAVVGKMEDKETDIEYVERRKKNNSAAKRSRELRKMKEDQLAINLAFLEAENHRLNLELNLAKERLHLYVSQGQIHAVGANNY